jgi:hypothetical protein
LQAKTMTLPIYIYGKSKISGRLSAPMKKVDLWRKGIAYDESFLSIEDYEIDGNLKRQA